MVTRAGDGGEGFLIGHEWWCQLRPRHVASEYPDTAKNETWKCKAEIPIRCSRPTLCAADKAPCKQTMPRSHHSESGERFPFVLEIRIDNFALLSLPPGSSGQKKPMSATPNLSGLSSTCLCLIRGGCPSSAKGSASFRAVWRKWPVSATPHFCS